MTEYQPQTFLGERGDTSLSVRKRPAPLRYRDVYEAVIIALVRSAGKPDDTNPYLLDLGEVDPVAVAQNTCIVLEERAEIYPHLPEHLLRRRDTDGR